MPGPAHLPEQNYLLAALPAEARARLFPHLELVPMPLGAVLYESGIRLRHVYFPTTCIVSLLYVMEDGASAEIAVTGYEGLVGIALALAIPGAVLARRFDPRVVVLRVAIAPDFV